MRENMIKCKTSKKVIKTFIAMLILLTLSVFAFAGSNGNQEWKGKDAISGTDYTIDGNNYIIKTPLGLAWALSGEAIKAELWKGYQGKTIILENDIDMSAAKFPTINYYQLKGTFDGNGKTITGIHGNNFKGLFEYNTSTGIIKNTTIKLNEDLFNNSYGVYGIIVNQNATGGTIQNCFVNGDGFSTNLAGIVGLNNGNILGCGVYDLTIKDYKSNIGAIAAQHSNPGVINNCFAINILFEYVSGQGTGGIVGYNGGAKVNILMPLLK